MGVEAGQAQRDLVVELVLVPRLNIPEALLQVVVVEEGDEEPRGIAVGTEDVFFNLFAEDVHVDHGCRRGGEARIGAEEVVDAVSVIAAVVESEVFQDGAQPNGARAEVLDIIEPLIDSGKLPALIREIIRIIEGRMDRRGGRIVEAVDHEEIDDLVPPVGGRRKRAGAGLPGGLLRIVEDSLDFR